MTRFSPTSSPWQLKQVEAARTSIDVELDRAMERGLDVRLAYALNKVATGTASFTAESQLERLLYTIAALAHHGRWGGLHDRDAAQLVNIAEALLLTHGVDKVTSTLSVLWGELYVAKSQILRLAGRTWESMWEQHMAHQASRRAPVGSPAFHSLAAGLRALRLGMLDVATQALDHAARGDLPLRNQEQARLGSIQAARLSGKHARAQHLLTELGARTDLSPLAQRDAHWEGLVQNAVASGSLAEMTVAVSSRGAHRVATFALEAFLWTRAVQSRQFEERLPGLRTLRKTCGDLLTRASAFRHCYEGCSHVDDAYDAERPLPQRTRALGKSLQDSALLPSLDKELLMRAAAFRWLYRSKQLEFAAFVYSDYELRCRQLSHGTDGDVLNLTKDVDRQSLLEHYVAPTLRSAS